MNYNFDSEIAVMVGVHAAVIYNNIRWWCFGHRANEDKKFFRDGRWWMISSMKAWAEIYPFLSEKQVRAALDKLIETKLVVKSNFNESRMDQTSWYSVELPAQKSGATPFAQKGKSSNIYNNIYNTTESNVNNITVRNHLEEEKKKKSFFLKEEDEQLLLTSTWAEQIKKNFALDDALLRKAIGRAKTYCLTENIDWTEQALKRYTLQELRLFPNDYKVKSPYEYVNKKGERCYDYGMWYGITIPDDAPPRPFNMVWSKERHCWAKDFDPDPTDPDRNS